MWLTLRKHLRVAGSIVIKKVLRDHSDWPRVKRSEDDRLRREYLTIFDDCCFYDATWVHIEMRERQTARAAAMEQQALWADATQEPDVPAWQRWQWQRVSVLIARTVATWNEGTPAVKSTCGS